LENKLSWVKEALSALRQGLEVDVRPQGGSMRGQIENGQRVTLAPVDSTQVQVDDAVLVEWKGNYLLHLVKGLTETEALIGNNVGRINGWVARSAILARVTRVHTENDHGSHPAG
jgi:hypothetical protein